MVIGDCGRVTEDKLYSVNSKAWKFFTYGPMDLKNVHNLYISISLLLMTVTAYVATISRILCEIYHCLLKGFLSLFELLF